MSLFLLHHFYYVWPRCVKTSVHGQAKIYNTLRPLQHFAIQSSFIFYLFHLFSILYCKCLMDVGKNQHGKARLD